MEQGYFDDTDEHEAYLKKYNDEYPRESEMVARLEGVFDFIDRMDLPAASRWWNKADIFSLIVELDSAFHERQLNLAPQVVGAELQELDAKLQRLAVHDPAMDDDAARTTLARYEYAAAQGSNHRKSRVSRGEILAAILDRCASSGGS